MSQQAGMLNGPTSLREWDCILVVTYVALVLAHGTAMQRTGMTDDSPWCEAASEQACKPRYHHALRKEVLPGGRAPALAGGRGQLLCVTVSVPTTARAGARRRLGREARATAGAKPEPAGRPGRAATAPRPGDP